MPIRPELRWGLILCAALGVAAIAGNAYARLMTPYYTFVTHLMAYGHPWSIDALQQESGDRPGSVLKLVATVHRPSGAAPSATVVSRLQVGAAIQTPLIFWTLLLFWPGAALHRRLWRVAVGMPVVLLLEAITTGVQLIHGLPAVSLLLDTRVSTPTIWDHWAEFLEGGGRILLVVCGVLLTLAVTGRRGAPC